MAVIPGFSIQHGKVISATLIVAVTGLILNPTLSVPLQLFQPPGWSWQCIPCPPSKMGLQAGSQPLPSDLKPGIGTGLPLPYFFFPFCILTGIVAHLFKYSLSFVFTGRTGLLAWSISRRNCFAVEVTNDSSAPLGCCDHFTREHMECRVQASGSLTVLI